MSWFDRYKPASNHPQVSEADLAAARQKKLQADRLLRQQRREELQNQFLASKKAQEEADLAYRELVHEFLQLDPNIFREDKMVVDFYEENGEDGEKALESLGGIQCPFMKDDVVFWFGQFEAQLMVIKVKSQWVKRIALQRFLPLEIQEEVKSLLRLTQSEAGNDIYKRLRAEIIELFGEKLEDGYARAKQRVMTGKPSQLGKALVDDICKKSKKLDGCCCAAVVWGMYRDAIPVVVRNHIAEEEFNKDTYVRIFKASDKVYASNQGPDPKPPVAAVTAANQQEVAAASFSKNKKNKNKGGGAPNKPNTPASNPNSSNNKGEQSQGGHKAPRHATAKGDNLCYIHHKWGVNANFCAAPWKCPMKDTWKAPQ